MEAHGTNSPVKLKVAEAVPDSRLLIVARGERATAGVELHPTFEGPFLVNSYHQDWARLIVDGETQDPRGEGRESARSTHYRIRFLGKEKHVMGS